MTHYQQLTTEKYWNESVQAEIKELTREKNRNKIRAFCLFVFAAAVFSITVFAVQQMPNWLPIVGEFMEQTGIIETLSLRN